MRGKKQDLRVEAVRQRESLPFSEACARSQLIQEAAIYFAPYLSADSVALYSALGNEVSTDKIRDHAFRTGKSVYYPGLAEEPHPNLIRAQSSGDLKPGRYGILEPAGEKALLISGQEGLVIFVPGLYFDRYGRRLGRGRGWYDRLLRGLGKGVTFIALAYEFQILEEVPVEPMDVSVHHIITERRIIDCRDPEAVGLNS